MLKLRDDADLAAKALAVQRRRDVGGEQLQCDRSAMFDIVREINRRHPTATDFTNDRVWPDGLAFEATGAVRARLVRGVTEEGPRGGIRAEHCRHSLTQLGISRGLCFEKAIAFTNGYLERSLEQRDRPFPLLGIHGSVFRV